jgi:hypothetical protein
MRLCGEGGSLHPCKSLVSEYNTRDRQITNKILWGRSYDWV